MMSFFVDMRRSIFLKLQPSGIIADKQLAEKRTAPRAVESPCKQIGAAGPNVFDKKQPV